MARISLFSTAALAALAAAALAVPAQAQEGGRHGRGAQADDGQARAEVRAQWREQRAAQAAAPQQEQRAQRAEAREQWRAQRSEQAAPQQRNAPEGGWRSQRPAEGTRYGRDWSNGGTVNRPAPAWRGATPQVPDRGVETQAAASRWGDRNRTYSDPQRSRTYRDGYRAGRTADSSRDRTEQRQAYRDGYRSGSTADSWRDRRDQTRSYRQGYTSGSRYSGNYDRWSRDSWRRDNRYNWYSYRSSNRDLYRLGRYYSPYRSWSYSRLRIGFFLQPLFYGSNYWINDPWQYRLPEAYGPYRWVRYYDDALLVDIYSGEVVDVIYDFFW